MAPLLKVLIQFLPTLPTTSNSRSPIKTQSLQPITNDVIPQAITHNLNPQQQAIPPIIPTPSKLPVPSSTPTPKYTGKTISTVSTSKHRLDVFGLSGNNVTHKYYDGHNWNPSGGKLELLGNGLATPPVAVSWGENRLDIFGLDDHGTIKHQYWHGSAWGPGPNELENLGGGCDLEYPISATTWGEGRLDIFCRGPMGELRHQFYDGSQWQPAPGTTESLGGIMSTGPRALSSGEGRLDIFSLDPLGQPIHLFYDGTKWSDWEYFPTDLKLDPSSLTVSTWGKDRLDIWASEPKLGLVHKFWDGHQWSDWESLGDFDGCEGISVASWGENRLDVVARTKYGKYLYKYYDGMAWQPNVKDFYEKGPLEEEVFGSSPSLVSWGENRLDIFGESNGEALLHQAWTGYDWFPGNIQWENLGVAESAESGFEVVGEL